MNAGKIDLDSVPELPGWVSIPQAAERLNISRQQAHKRAAKGRFPNMRRVGQFLIIPEEDLTEPKVI